MTRKRSSNDRLLDVLYGAASGESSWDEFLVLLASEISSVTSQIVLFDSRHSQYTFTASHRFPPEAARLYGEYYAAIDEWYLRAKGRVSPGYVGEGEALCCNSELVKTEFYDGFLRPFDYLYECAAVLEQNSNSMAVLTNLRSRRHKPFGTKDLRNIEGLLPHLQRALKLHRRIVDLNGRDMIETWALEQVGFGVILLSKPGTILFANQNAVRLCTSGLRLKPEGLTAGCPRENRQLQSFIHSAANPLMGVSPGGVMAVSREGECLEPLLVSVAPVRRDSQGLCGAVIVFVVDPSQSNPRTAEMFLRQVYRLTTAEARLALLIGSGTDVPNAAEVMGITRSTARSYLKSVFQKTSVCRQSQLVRLIAMLPPIARA
jgi:DNA-binding CsgD family transcriptional regulator